MPHTYIDPDGLAPVGLYSHVAVATGSRFITIAGQVAVDSTGATIGIGDLAAQVEQAYLNVGSALAAADATFDDIVRLTVYLVDWTPDRMSELTTGIDRARARLGTTATPPFTGIVVTALAGPDLLVEVEATAVTG